MYKHLLLPLRGGLYRDARAPAFLFHQWCHNLCVYPNFESIKMNTFQTLFYQNDWPEFWLFWSFVFQWVSDSSSPSFLLTILSFVCSAYQMNFWFLFMQSVARWWLDKKQPDLPQNGTKLPQLLWRGSVPFEGSVVRVKQQVGCGWVFV